MRFIPALLCAAVLGVAALSTPLAGAEADHSQPGAAQTEAPTVVAPEAVPDRGPAAKPAPPQPDTSEQRSGKLWVCCDDGQERWTATNEVCRKKGGQLLPSRFCERPTYVCCKQGRAEWWMPNRDACHEDGGVVADASYCR